MGHTIERRHVADPAELDDPEFRRFYAYFLKKADGRPYPSRCDLDPLDFPYALPNIMLVAVEPGPRFVYRLAGTRVVERIGVELTGKSTGDISDEGIRLSIESCFHAMVEDQRPVLVSSPAFTINGRTLSVESLHLPLGSDGRVDMILIISHQTVLKPPAWKRVNPR